MPFTPNLNQDQIDDLDRRRGDGDTNSPYTLSQNHEPINKKPYLNTDGTHKAIDDKIKGNKNMSLPETEKSVAPQTYSNVRHYTGNVGGQPKSAQFGVPSSLKSMDDNKKVEELLDWEKKEHGHVPTPKEEKDECKDEMKKDMMSPPSAIPTPPMTGMTKALEILKGMPKFEKALTTRSARFVAPLVYDGAATVTNAAAITFTPVDWNNSYEPARNFGEALKSCHVHGITFKSTAGCTPCRIAKSAMCEKCGGQMHKGPGGNLSCSVHG